MTSSDNPVTQFFITVSEIFFRINMRTDWKISVFSYDDLQKVVSQSYTSCGAVLAKPPNIPTEAQKLAMTDMLQWGKELVADDKYQLELHFDPQYRNNEFVNCFNKYISDWVNHKANHSQENIGGIIGIVAFVVVVVVLAAIAFCLYKKWKSSSNLGPYESGRGLFHRLKLRKTSGENSTLIGDNPVDDFENGDSHGDSSALYQL